MEIDVESVPEAQPDRNVQEVLKHVVSLDGVRGTAILLVFCYHMQWTSSGTSSRVVDFALELRSVGWVGVDLFFTLSGFLITGILFESIHDRRFFKNFYARRVFRIFPLYYGFVLVLAIMFLIEGAHRDLHLLGFVALYLQNTPFFLDHAQNTSVLTYTSHLWSLAVEEQFYLVWPVIVFLVRDRRRLMWVAAALAILAPFIRGILLAHGTPFDEVYRNTLCRADSLLVGAWLALALKGSSTGKVLKAGWPCFCLGLALCIGIAGTTGNFDFEKNYAVSLVGFSAVGLVSASLIALALRAGSIVEWMMRARWLRFLGRYSYGIYVYHETVLNMPWLAFKPQQATTNNVYTKVVFHLATLFLSGGLTILIAVASFQFYEKPFLKMKRFFNYDRP